VLVKAARDPSQTDDIWALQLLLLTGRRKNKFLT
jgi:hypothetical protein